MKRLWELTLLVLLTIYALVDLFFLNGINTMAATAYDGTNLLQVVVSVFNLLIVIYIFSHNKQEKANNQKRDTYLYWFRKTVLDECIPLINKFFDESSQYIESEVSNRRGDESIDRRLLTDFNAQLLKTQLLCFNSFMDYLSLLNEYSSTKVQESLEEYIDKLVKLAQNSLFDDKIPPIDTTELSRQYKAKMFREIYSASLRLPEQYLAK